MSKIVVLANDDIIDGIPRVAGQVVIVPDGYSNYRRIISTTQAVTQQSAQVETQLTWRKFVEMFLVQYPAFAYVEEKYPELVSAVSVRPTLIQRLMSEPQLIEAMLANAEYAATVIGQYPAITGGD